MSATRPWMMRVPAPLVVAVVWVLSTLYMFIAQSQHVVGPWGAAAQPQLERSPTEPGGAWPALWTQPREQAVLCIAAVLLYVACRLLARWPLWSMTALMLNAFVLNYDFHTSNIAPDQYLGVCVALFFVSANGSRRTALLAAALAFTGLASYVLACVARGLAVDTPVEAVVLLTTALAWVLGNSQRRERLHGEQLRTQLAERAVTAERLRIARELHDLVAHNIGVVALQAGAAKMVIQSRPEDARQALGSIESTSRETLTGLRRMLGALHDAESVTPSTPPAGLDEVDKLLANARATGVHLDVEWRGERRPLPPEIDLSAFRIIQESVTNVLKHSGARQCRVSVTFRDDDVTLAIMDNGTRTGGGTGYGIIGMRDRVELLHGDFSAGPRPDGGFRVTARIPIPAEV